MAANLRRKNGYLFQQVPRVGTDLSASIRAPHPNSGCPTLGASLYLRLGWEGISQRQSWVPHPNLGCPTFGAPLYLRLGWDGTSRCLIVRREFQARTFPRSPRRLDLDDTRLSGKVMSEARRSPLVWLRDEAAGYRVAMDVAQLLSLFRAGAHIEVVITNLPEWSLQGLFGNRSLERLDGARESAAPRLGYEQMHMLRHDNITEDMEDVSPSHLLQRSLEQLARRIAAEVRKPMVATEGDEMEITCQLVTLEL